MTTTSKPTKTLNEYNEERLAFWNSGKKFKGERIGVKCPKCPGQLLFVDHNPNMTTFPPTKKAHCSKCSYVGRVYV